MDQQLYFAIKNYKEREKLDKIRSSEYLESLYMASVPGREITYLFGVSRGKNPLIPAHDGINNFVLLSKSILFDFKKEPTYVSISWFNKPVAHEKIKSFFDALEEKGDGLEYGRHVRYGNATGNWKFHSFITRAVLSEESFYSIDKKIKQGLVIEMGGNQQSASKMVPRLKEGMERETELEILKTDVFCIIGGNIKKNVARPGAPEKIIKSSSYQIKRSG